jgi:hypothetical protein
MKFCAKPIPEGLFSLARAEMRARESFTPAELRNALVSKGKVDMLSITDHPRNHQIIANRVMSAVIHELVAKSELWQLKRGVWGRGQAHAAARSVTVSS